MSEITLDELKRIAESVEERRGWDFSQVREDIDPVPWEYLEVVRRYLKPTHHVLDVGTGGGERFLSLASDFGSGVGVDISPEMVRTACENTLLSLSEWVSFEVMPAEKLDFSDESFDVVMNRHSVVCVDEIVRVLRLGGYFINQQVGSRNTENICTLLGCGVGGEYEVHPEQETQVVREAFKERGCRVIASAEYDVPYYFVDVESLVFWHKALPLPEDFTIETHWPQVAYIIQAYSTPRGIETNEHRELLIVQKRWA